MRSLSSLFFATFLCIFLDAALAGDPFVYYDWTVSYTTASPLGVKQQVPFLPSLISCYLLAFMIWIIFFCFLLERVYWLCNLDQSLLSTCVVCLYLLIFETVSTNYCKFHTDKN